MKYISDHPIRWNYTKYFDYIEQVKTQMPSHIYAFASDSSNYDLRSKNSLHDAWLEELRINESGSSNNRKLTAQLVLLGPFHDCKIHIRYTDVRSYNIFYRDDDELSLGHGDILVHEVRIADDDLFEHEIEFSSGRTLLFRFKEFEHWLENK